MRLPLLSFHALIVVVVHVYELFGLFCIPASSTGFPDIFLAQRAIGRLGENKRARVGAGSKSRVRAQGAMGFPAPLFTRKYSMSPRSI